MWWDLTSPFSVFQNEERVLSMKNGSFFHLIKSQKWVWETLGEKKMVTIHLQEDSDDEQGLY